MDSMSSFDISCDGLVDMEWEAPETCLITHEAMYVHDEQKPPAVCRGLLWAQ